LVWVTSLALGCCRFPIGYSWLLLAVPLMRGPKGGLGLSLELIVTAPAILGIA